MAVGMSNGAVEIFDPFLMRADIIKLNPADNPNRQKEAVSIVRFVPGGNEILAIFADSSMHVFYISSTRTEPYLPALIIDKMREVEKLTPESDEKSLIANDSVKFELHLNKDPLRDFAVGFTERSVNPCAVWKFFNAIQELKFSPVKIEGHFYFALAAKDPYLKIFNYEEKRLVCVHRSYYGNVLCLDYSGDGRLLAAGCEDDTITVYNTLSNEALCRCTGHRSFISSVRFDSTYDAQLNSCSSEEGNTKDGERGLENVQKNYKQLTEAELIAAVKAVQSDPSIGTREANRNLVYRIISTGHDCMVSMWDIDVTRAKSHTEFQRNKCRRKGSALNPEEKKIADSNKAAYKDYPSLFWIYNVDPLIRERVHGNPIMKMETIKSFIFTISQSGNFRLFKPSVSVRKILMEEQIEEENDIENPQLDIKLSNFRTKNDLDGYFTSIKMQGASASKQ